MGEPFTCAGPGNPEDWIRNAEEVPQKIISDQIREGRTPSIVGSLIQLKIGTGRTKHGPKKKSRKKKK